MAQEKQSVTIYTNGEHFFVATPDIKRVCDDFVPIPFVLPHSVKPRPGLSEGIVKTAEDVVRVYFQGEKEIFDPSSKFAVDYR